MTPTSLPLRNKTLYFKINNLHKTNEVFEKSSVYIVALMNNNSGSIQVYIAIFTKKSSYVEDIFTNSYQNCPFNANGIVIWSHRLQKSIYLRYRWRSLQIMKKRTVLKQPGVLCPTPYIVWIY